MKLRDLIVVGVTLGVVAATIVWFLERGSVERLARDFGAYLDKHAAFRAWEEKQSGDA